MGWFLNYEEQFILITTSTQIEDLTRKLMRIGLDNMYGYIQDVHEPGLPLQTADVIDIQEFKSYLGKDNVQVVDVRGESEFNSAHVPGAEHVFLGTLPQNLDKISKEKQVVIYCQAGDRSAIAYSLLSKNGFNNVKNYSGGMKEWLGKKNSVTKNSEIVCCQ